MIIASPKAVQKRKQPNGNNNKPHKSARLLQSPPKLRLLPNKNRGKKQASGVEAASTSTLIHGEKEA